MGGKTTFGLYEHFSLTEDSLQGNDVNSGDNSGNDGTWRVPLGGDGIPMTNFELEVGPYFEHRWGVTQVGFVLSRGFSGNIDYYRESIVGGDGGTSGTGGASDTEDCDRGPDGECIDDGKGEGVEEGESGASDPGTKMASVASWIDTSRLGFSVTHLVGNNQFEVLPERLQFGPSITLLWPLRSSDPVPVAIPSSDGSSSQYTFSDQAMSWSATAVGDVEVFETGRTSGHVRAELGVGSSGTVDSRDLHGIAGVSFGMRHVIEEDLELSNLLSSKERTAKEIAQQKEQEFNRRFEAGGDLEGVNTAAGIRDVRFVITEDARVKNEFYGPDLETVKIHDSSDIYTGWNYFIILKDSGNRTISPSFMHAPLNFNTDTDIITYLEARAEAITFTNNIKTSNPAHVWTRLQTLKDGDGNNYDGVYVDVDKPDSASTAKLGATDYTFRIYVLVNGEPKALAGQEYFSALDTFMAAVDSAEAVAIEGDEALRIQKLEQQRVQALVDQAIQKAFRTKAGDFTASHSVTAVARVTKPGEPKPAGFEDSDRFKPQANPSTIAHDYVVYQGYSLDGGTTWRVNAETEQGYINQVVKKLRSKYPEFNPAKTQGDEWSANYTQWADDVVQEVFTYKAADFMAAHNIRGKVYVGYGDEPSPREWIDDSFTPATIDTENNVVIWTCGYLYDEDATTTNRVRYIYQPITDETEYKTWLETNLRAEYADFLPATGDAAEITRLQGIEQPEVDTALEKVLKVALGENIYADLQANRNASIKAESVVVWYDPSSTAPKQGMLLDDGYYAKVKVTYQPEGEAAYSKTYFVGTNYDQMLLNVGTEALKKFSPTQGDPTTITRLESEEQPKIDRELEAKLKEILSDAGYAALKADSDAYITAKVKVTWYADDDRTPGKGLELEDGYFATVVMTYKPKGKPREIKDQNIFTDYSRLMGFVAIRVRRDFADFIITAADPADPAVPTMPAMKQIEVMDARKKAVYASIASVAATDFHASWGDEIAGFQLQADGTPHPDNPITVKVSIETPGGLALAYTDGDGYEVAGFPDHSVHTEFMYAGNSITAAGPGDEDLNAFFHDLFLIKYEKYTEPKPAPTAPVAPPPAAATGPSTTEVLADLDAKYLLFDRRSHGDHDISSVTQLDGLFTAYLAADASDRDTAAATFVRSLKSARGLKNEEKKEVVGMLVMTLPLSTYNSELSNLVEPLKTYDLELDDLILAQKPIGVREQRALQYATTLQNTFNQKLVTYSNSDTDYLVLRTAMRQGGNLQFTMGWYHKGHDPRLSIEVTAPSFDPTTKGLVKAALENIANSELESYADYPQIYTASENPRSGSRHLLKKNSDAEWMTIDFKTPFQEDFKLDPGYIAFEAFIDPTQVNSTHKSGDRVTIYNECTQQNLTYFNSRNQANAAAIFTYLDNNVIAASEKDKKAGIGLIYRDFAAQDRTAYADLYTAADAYIKANTDTAPPPVVAPPTGSGNFVSTDHETFDVEYIAYADANIATFIRSGEIDAKTRAYFTRPMRSKAQDIITKINALNQSIDTRIAIMQVYYDYADFYSDDHRELMTTMNRGIVALKEEKRTASAPPPPPPPTGPTPEEQWATYWDTAGPALQTHVDQYWASHTDELQALANKLGDANINSIKVTVGVTRSKYFVFDSAIYESNTGVNYPEGDATYTALKSAAGEIDDGFTWPSGFPGLKTAEQTAVITIKNLPDPDAASAPPPADAPITGNAAGLSVVSVEVLQTTVENKILEDYKNGTSMFSIPGLPEGGTVQVLATLKRKDGHPYFESTGYKVFDRSWTEVSVTLTDDQVAEYIDYLNETLKETGLTFKEEYPEVTGFGLAIKHEKPEIARLQVAEGSRYINRKRAQVALGNRYEPYSNYIDDQRAAYNPIIREHTTPVLYPKGTDKKHVDLQWRGRVDLVINKSTGIVDEVQVETYQAIDDTGSIGDYGVGTNATALEEALTAAYTGLRFQLPNEYDMEAQDMQMGEDDDYFFVRMQLKYFWTGKNKRGQKVPQKPHDEEVIGISGGGG
jgi:hypothetical protein